VCRNPVGGWQVVGDRSRSPASPHRHLRAPVRWPTSMPFQDFKLMVVALSIETDSLAAQTQAAIATVSIRSPANRGGHCAFGRRRYCPHQHPMQTTRRLIRPRVRSDAGPSAAKGAIATLGDIDHEWVRAYLPSLRTRTSAALKMVSRRNLLSSDCKRDVAGYAEICAPDPH